MTICVAVKVGEGLVLAADSASTLLAPNGSILRISPYARKLAQVKDYPVGVLTWGQGAIGGQTIESLLLEFADQLLPVQQMPQLNVKDVADNLFRFVDQRYAAAFGSSSQVPRPPLGMLVGGLSTGKVFTEIYVFEFPAANPPTLVLTDQPDGSPSFGVVYYGQIDALTRLLRGYDPHLPQLLLREGVPQNVIEQVLQQLRYPIPFPHMPLQDAVEFAVYLCDVVVGRFRFVVGPPLCGGAVDVAVVTQRGFQWLKQKSLFVP